MVRSSRQRWTSSQMLAFTEESEGSKKPRLRRGNSCTLVCISSPPWFFCSSWWCVDPEDNDEETSGDRSSPIEVSCDVPTNFHVEQFIFTIAYVDPDIAGKRVGQNNSQPFPWHWPGVDESIVLIGTSIVDSTILSIVNAAIAGPPDPSRIIRELWRCMEEPNGDCSPYTCNVTPIFDNNTAARWVKVLMKLSNPTLVCVVYRGQQADCTADAQMPMRGGRSYLPLDDILLPPAKDIID